MDDSFAVSRTIIELGEWVQQTLSWGLAAGLVGAECCSLAFQGRTEEANSLLLERLKLEIKSVLSSVAGNRAGEFADLGYGALLNISDPKQRGQLITATLRRALELAETVDCEPGERA